MKVLRMMSLLFLVIAGPLWAAKPTASVMVVTIDGVIDPVVADHVKDTLTRAEKEGAAAVLIELDTPGGLLDATRSIIGAMINSPLPVIVHVSPKGARATSAGVFITVAADVAAMSPDTHIGAAHPVTIGGGDKKPAGDKGDKPSAMEEKMVSDAAAYIRTLARERGRNADWAEQAVRESVSLTADEALRNRVVDLVSDGREALLKAVEGRVLQKGGRTIRLALAGAPIVPAPMSRMKRLLHLLAHPNVAYILMMIGIYGLIYELSAPGIGLGGVMGGMSLLLAFYSLQVIPLNTLGLALMALGAMMLLLEVFSPSHGLLTLGGAIAFALGSFVLVDADTGLHYPRVSPGLIIPSTIGTGLVLGFFLKKALAIRRAQPKVGIETLIGQEAEVRKEIAPEGLVFINGELWTARSTEPVPVGARVVIERVLGTVLFVKKPIQ